MNMKKKMVNEMKEISIPPGEEEKDHMEGYEEVKV